MKKQSLNLAIIFLMFFVVFGCKKEEPEDFIEKYYPENSASVNFAKLLRQGQSKLSEPASGIKRVTTEELHGYYKVTNLSFGQSLDVAGGGKWNGCNILLYPYNGQNNQKWIISVNNKSEYIKLYPKHVYLDFFRSTKVMEVFDGSMNRENVSIYDVSRGAHQEWQLIGRGTPFNFRGLIVNRKSGRLLTGARGVTNGGSPIINVFVGDIYNPSIHNIENLSGSLYGYNFVWDITYVK